MKKILAVKKKFENNFAVWVTKVDKLGIVLVHCILISLYGAIFMWNWKAMAHYVAKTNMEIQ